MCVTLNVREYDEDSNDTWNTNITAINQAHIDIYIHILCHISAK